MKKLALSLSLALALSSVSTVFAAIPQKIRIGTDPTYAPFESKNAQGELVGFDIDLAKELCKRINTQCTFVENPLDALIPSLKAKKIDAIMSSLSITEKRQQEIAFTDKLYAADSRLVVKKGSPRHSVGRSRFIRQLRREEQMEKKQPAAVWAIPGGRGFLVRVADAG